MFEIKESKIHGKGLFASHDIPEGRTIGVWCSNTPSHGCRYLIKNTWYENYPIGRYCNHSNIPNTYYINKDGNITIKSKGIQKGEEILVDYRWTHDLFGFSDKFSRDLVREAIDG